MKEITTVGGIRRRFRALVADLDVEDCYKTFHTAPPCDGGPHIEKEGDEFHYVLAERGTEFERKKTKDPEEILYLLLQGVTFHMATKYELKNRIDGRDGREMFFPYQEKLLYDLKPEWGIRNQEEHFQILRDHPLRGESFMAAVSRKFRTSCFSLFKRNR